MYILYIVYTVVLESWIWPYTYFAQWILHILRNVYFSRVTRYCIYFGINFRKLLLTMSQQHVILDSVILLSALHINTKYVSSKVSFFVQCIKKQLITLQNFNSQTCFSQFLWFFSLKFWFKGQIISRIHLILPNAYKLLCFDRNINGNRDVKFLECDYFLVQRSVKLTLRMSGRIPNPYCVNC